MAFISYGNKPGRSVHSLEHKSHMMQILCSVLTFSTKRLQTGFKSDS
jgi:hypothetical protein